ncbi:hypothetical protein B7494_g5773 [Chlorociboria aeruginascens]|nr:hypothetical protein B7494_g5773 [Chlorociboria aeruginascens]
MTPRKPRAKQTGRAPSLQQIQASDNDYEGSYYPPPQAVKRTNTDLNMSVLARYIPSIHSILCIAASCRIFTFSPSLHTWENSGIEGTLFVYDLTPSADGLERYGLVLLNRRGPENFIVELRDMMTVELGGEYLILRFLEGGEEKCVGVWVFPDTEQTREMCNGKIMECWERCLRQELQEMEGQDGERFREEGQDLGDVSFLEDETGDEIGNELQKKGRRLSLRDLFSGQAQNEGYL